MDASIIELLRLKLRNDFTRESQKVEEPEDWIFAEIVSPSDIR